ncbi:unnamed protein product [Linum trigynum]|uniref:Sulfite exporter TauE/SafE family protein n=1 Tax=Linum trigynum TaxID=586398 RepID=A0AAV2FHD6_9ROSI
MKSIFLKLLSISIPILLISFPQFSSSTDPSRPDDDEAPGIPSMVAAAMLCFLAASISSAGGIGGGGLFIPVLTIVAGFDLTTASALSAFMVAGGSVANVACCFIRKFAAAGGRGAGGRGTRGGIDFDIALMSEPMMLLGVSVGVIWNVVFPEWLITVMFVGFLVWSTLKTCRNGMKLWNLETEQRSCGGELGTGDDKSGGGGGEEGGRQPLLVTGEKNGGGGFPWIKLGVLVVVWISFSSLYLLRGNRHGEGLIEVKPCGFEYWALSSLQIPLAILFTAWILLRSKTHEHEHHQPTNDDENLQVSARISRAATNRIIFPIMALLAGILGGVFGIGGGMLISPLLLQVGIAAEVTAATCSFMVFFSSSMSAFQYLLLGMEHINTAIILSATCFVASLLGLLVVHRAIEKYGRASLIVFSVAIVMALSTVLMTSYGALQVWRDYQAGNYMGFKPPC